MSFPRHRPSPQDTRNQYARQAQRYAESSLHRRGESLEAVRRLARASAADTVLDLLLLGQRHHPGDKAMNGSGARRRIR